MGPLDYFFADVPHVFRFLEEEYACKRLPSGTDPRGYAGYVPYRNATTEVLIQYEFGSAPWIVLSPIQSDGTIATVAVSLDFMIELVGGNPVNPPPASETSNEAIDQMLRALASWLRRLCHEFLSGQFDGFAELSRQQRQAHLKREREFYGDSNS
jgi:hypothetical protein